MRVAILIVAVAFLIHDAAGPRRVVRAYESAAVLASSASTKPARIEFDSQVKPILQSKCMPCHFTGGKMYERLPFDRPETVRKLGTKLFTRISDENHRRTISDFLAQEP